MLFCFPTWIQISKEKKNETRSSDLRNSSGVENYNKQRRSQNIFKLKMSTHKNSEIMWESERPVWLWKSHPLLEGDEAVTEHITVLCANAPPTILPAASAVDMPLYRLAFRNFSHFLQRWCAACAMVFEMHASAVTCQTYTPTPIQATLFREQLYPNVI